MAARLRYWIRYRLTLRRMAKQVAGAGYGLSAQRYGRLKQIAALEAAYASAARHPAPGRDARSDHGPASLLLPRRVRG